MSGRHLSLLLAGLIVFPVAMTLAQPLHADEPPAKTEEKPAEAAPATDAKPADSDWDTLAARKLEIAKELKTLSEEFKTATVERKRAIQGLFQQLILEFNVQLAPQMAALAPEVFAKDPKNYDAGEFVLQTAWDENRYADAVAAAEQMVASGHESQVVLNLGGCSNYAAHNFERAHELLTKAKEQGKLDIRTGERFIEEAKAYQEFWKQEQELRAKEAAAEGDARLPRVEFVTTKGKIVLELFENEAPNTVANFISLVESKHYDGIKFHRVIPNFMAQGGDPNSKDDDPTNDGIGDIGYTIKCECWQENARKHFAGSLSMAKTNAPHSGGSQFFLTHLPTHWLNGNAEQESGHTVFGRVVEGLDIVGQLEVGDTIESATVLFKRNHEYVPVKYDPAAEAKAKADAAAAKGQTEPETKPEEKKPE